MYPPAYLELGPGELRRRAEQAVASLAECRACPRDCGVDRLANQWSACKTGRYAVVSSCFAHLGEEDCLRGTHGSGTIFFAHCNLRCVFCQNYDISQAVRPTDVLSGTPPAELARMMLRLQQLGCHNINFVTPEHVVPQIIEALADAVDAGLRLPVVYNTGAYDSLESLRLCDGIVDIYMPDFKYWSPTRSRTYLKADDYPQAAREAIREMHRQAGPLLLDADGIAQRGVLVRHLIMPGGIEETEAILSWIATELGTDTFINLMDQYHPAGQVAGDRFSEINRRLSIAELEQAYVIAARLGLNRLDRRVPR